MDCGTIIDLISLIRLVITFAPPVLGAIAGFRGGFIGSLMGGGAGGFIGYILNVISKLPAIEKLLIKILSVGSEIGECS